jgi:O-acetyl-ADP-ribose deacetylase (regulator of RNase III)/uncharacterized protein YwgA
MFKTLIGDMFQSKAQTLVNTINCVGIMGKGVAQEFKKRFEGMFTDYEQRCLRNEVRLGEPYLYEADQFTKIVMFPTKNHWRAASRIVDIEAGLNYFREHYKQWGITSIAFPPLGCGNGGLDWEDVGPLMHSKLHDLPIDVQVFAPFGTPKDQVTEEFLSTRSTKGMAFKGRRLEKFNPEWVVLMEVLRQVGNQPYANPIGRVIFQKVCYVLTEMGVKTGFQFGKGHYGPFAKDVNAAIHVLANKNWIVEEQLGQMNRMRASAQYEQDRAKYADTIKHHNGRIAMAVDLFSRIQNTEQAEEVFSVLFASRQLKNGDAKSAVSEDQLYKYIVDWKPKWAKDTKSWRAGEKKHAVESAIRNLAMLGWLNVEFSADMMAEA